MAELIERKDSLNKGRIKLNDAIKMVDNFQRQLDTIVVEGDSSVEAAQARFDKNNYEYGSLKERLDTEQGELDDLTERFFREQITLDDISEPLYICHRGAKNIFPENTLEAYRGCLALGNPLIEQDVRRLGDGTLAVIHDDKVDRVTDGTGKVNELSAMSFTSLNVTTLKGWENARQVLFEDVLREFGKRAIYVPEIKVANEGSGEEVVSLLKKYNLEKNAIVQSFHYDELIHAINEDIPAMFLTNSKSPTTMKADGITYVGVSDSVDEAYIDDCINEGLKVVVWTINRRYKRDFYLSKNVHGFFTDDPFYLDGSMPVLKKAPFANSTYYHGHLGAYGEDGALDLGLMGNNRFRWLQMGERNFVLQGWAGELPDEFIVKVDVNWLHTRTNQRWFSVALCTPIDYFDDNRTDLSNGYHILFNRTQGLVIYVVEDGVANMIDKEEEAELLELPTDLSITVEVTNSTIKATRSDTNVTIQINDNKFRNGYLHLGKRASLVEFKNVEIIEI